MLQSYLLISAVTDHDTYQFSLAFIWKRKSLFCFIQDT